MFAQMFAQKFVSSRYRLLQLHFLLLQRDSSLLYTSRVRCRQVILRYKRHFGLILVEAVQLLRCSPLPLLQEQTSGTQAAQQAEPKQAASQVSIKPCLCFKHKLVKAATVLDLRLAYFCVRNAAELVSMAYRSSRVRSSKVFRMQKTNLQVTPWLQVAQLHQLQAV